jgi:spermidine/putrescine transport system permease protein
MYDSEPVPVRMLMPPVFWLLVFFVIPLGIILLYSIGYRDSYGGVAIGFTLNNYSAVIDPLYSGIILRSFLWALITTIVCVLVAYPMAYYAAFAPARMRALVIFLVIVPFWTSFLVRLYSFTAILGTSGIVNNTLMSLGLASEPLPLLHTPFSVILGFVYVNLPFMFLPLFSALDRIDTSLIEASMDLGASRFRTFMRVSLPYSLSGIATGVVFVFIPTLGSFIVPDVLGGTGTLMLGNVITSQFLTARNWPAGSALSMALLFMVMVCVAAYIRYGRRGETGGM